MSNTRAFVDSIEIEWRNTVEGHQQCRALVRLFSTVMLSEKTLYVSRDIKGLKKQMERRAKEFLLEELKRAVRDLEDGLNVASS